MFRDRRQTRRLVLLLVGVFVSAAPLEAAQSSDFKPIDRIIAQTINEKKFPGAVVIVGHHGRIVFHKAYGNRSLIPQPEAMSENTIFDVASLTKVLATTTAIMQLYEQGRFTLNDPVAKY